MKTLRRISATMILSLTFAVSVLAGHMDTTGVVAPPPPPPNSTAQTTEIATSILLTMLGLVYP